MSFKFISFDESGNPTMVATDDGFCQTSRKFDPKAGGWMLDQIDPREFKIIGMGKDTEFPVSEVNSLRREVHRLNNIISGYKDIY